MTTPYEPMETENSFKSKKKREKTAFDKLPFEVQEEIDCLYEFVPEIESHFEVIDKIGEGTFSSVFLAKLKHCPEVTQLFALKHIIPTSHPSRIEGELRCLLEIGGLDNVMGVELCIRNRDHVVIVMQYFPHEKFQDYILDMSVDEVREYMKNLMLALRRVHMFDVIHRDVKPSNFLYDRKTKRYALVDFGLAHKLVAGKRSSLEPNPSNTAVGVLTPSIDTSNKMNTTSTSKDSSKKNDNSSGRQFTPSPPTSLTNSVFAKRMKSPRRLLLAKRALHMKEKQTSSNQYQPAACQCFGKPQTCQICSSRCNQIAPRAGTPGFRSPEVLMKCPDQSTAVDIWSAGVIFLSLMSGRYPFFRANDDMTALAQIITTFGTDAMKAAAEACGKNLVCSPAQSPVEIGWLCMKLRTASVGKTSSKKNIKDNEEAERSWRTVPDSAFDLLSRLLDLNPYTRITADEALKHPFLVDC